jgi:mRNA interferase MazF
MIDYEFGDVVLVPFPFTDQTAGKKRPAVVVSSNAYIREHPDLVLMAVTSQMRSSPAVGEVILTEWKTAGLLKPSHIKPIFTTIEKGLVLRKLGRLAPDDRKALCQALKEILGE